MSDENKDLVCVLCGKPWHPCANVCQCGGFSTWGKAKGGPPSSWDVDIAGKWTPKPVPKDHGRLPMVYVLLWLIGVPLSIAVVVYILTHVF